MRTFLRRLQLALAPLALFGAAQAHADPVAESLGDGIVRFWPDRESCDAATPSISLITQRAPQGEVPAGFTARPTFVFQNGERVVRLAAPRGTSLYGTGEAPGRLLRNGRTTTCWNTDAYAWDQNSPSLYQSHPWVLGVRADGSSFGVLADTPARITVDLARGIEFRAQGEAFPVIVIERRTPQEVLTALADLTGHMPMPPRWALGFQQCRYSYAPAAEVLRIAREFRTRALPCDVLWMDIDYMSGNRPFTIDPIGFPDPKGLSDTLHTRGFRSVWIIDPGIRQAPGDLVYEQGTQGSHWVKMPDGQPFTGRVWPGLCVFPDFTRRETRAWWGSLTAAFAARSGADGIWNDMNEPAVFGTDNKSMSEFAHHEADAELGGPGSHARYHNVYGMQMARATREGLLAARPERRPFVLSRANHIGGQRYAAAWTGDNRSSDDHLRMVVPMVLNFGLSGQPFSGPDIGGYAGALEGEEYARWIGVGALLPFARAHTEKGNIRKEPWSFGPAIEAMARRALETRYRLLPHLYTVFEEAARTGLPVARPAFFADLSSEELRGAEHEFLIGSDLLVHIGWAESAPDVASLTRGKYAWPEATIVPAGKSQFLPSLHVRPGAIVPLGPVMAYSDERSLDDVELLVAPDAHGHAEGWLYEDAGDGYGFEKGEFRRTHFTAETTGHTVRVRIAGTEGTWTPSGARKVRVTLLGAPKGATSEGP